MRISIRQMDLGPGGIKMPYCFQSHSGEFFILHSVENTIFLQFISPRGFQRQTLIADDYRGSLSAVLYRDDIIYSYMDNNGLLKVRSIDQKLPLYTTKAAVSTDMFSPMLVILNDELMLLHMQEGEAFRGQLLLTLPLKSETFVLLKNVLSEIMAFCQDSTGLFVVTSESMTDPSRPDSCHLYRLTQEHALRECLCENYSATESLLEEKEALQNKLQLASVQYEELMEVACQYRDEARKWYQKVINR